MVTWWQGKKEGNCFWTPRQLWRLYQGESWWQIIEEDDNDEEEEGEEEEEDFVNRILTPSYAASSQPRAKLEANTNMNKQIIYGSAHTHTHTENDEKS